MHGSPKYQLITCLWKSENEAKHAENKAQSDHMGWLITHVPEPPGN